METGMTHSVFRHSLLSGSALLLSALVASGCSNSDTPASSAQKVVDNMTKNAPKMLEFNTPGQTNEDHIYLEEVLGEKALLEVKSWNARTLERLTSDPRFAVMQADALKIVNSKDKIPYVSYRGGEVHNFWQDTSQVRGVWRKTTLENYLSRTPEWETVLDFDALSEAEGKNWVYKGNSCLGPDYDICIVNLSDGGKDAVVRREFNTRSKTFVSDGFVTQESKGASDWLDKDRLIIGTDFGVDDAGVSTMTNSGYPRVAKLWTRGTPLSSAEEIMQGDLEDVGMWAWTLEMSDSRREIIAQKSLTFFEKSYFWVPQKDGALQPAVPIDIPRKSVISGEFKGQILVSLNDNWRGYNIGDLVSFSADDFMEDGKIDAVNLVFAPDEKSSIENFGATKSKVLISIYTDVKGAARSFDWDGTQWTSKALDFPKNGSVSIGATNDKEDVAFISSESFLSPDTLWTYNTETGERAKAKSLPAWFDASSMTAEQFFSTSSDGTKIPYFVVRKKGLKMDGNNPTLLYGYGGFKVSINPSYSATRGKLWLENGGVYVLANIRGGDEYGPKWHQAGLKTNRQRIYDDFISVAEDLIESKITSPKHLGIEGGSNGGLLVGVMFTQRPDLFNAVVCAVPLLDMMRYHTLLAGASWVGEYGDPEDPAEGAFLRTISPYHNIDPEADYPEVFFLTSTKDDRVHPGHARKAAKRMEDQGHDFLYYENIDGGHSAAANLEETAKRLALQHTYLMQKLKDGQ